MVPDYPKRPMRIIVHLRALVFICLCASGLTRAANYDAIPNEIVLNTTAMVLYHSGRMDVFAENESRRFLPNLPAYSFHELADMERNHAYMFRVSSLFAFAYFLGRVNGWEELGDTHPTVTVTSCTSLPSAAVALTTTVAASSVTSTKLPPVISPGPLTTERKHGVLSPKISGALPLT